MTWGPAGHWGVRVRALGTRPGGCPDRDVRVDVAVDGTLTIVDPARVDGVVLVGTWHHAGAGRVVVRVEGPWGAVEAAVELSADGATCTGRALGRATSDVSPGARTGAAEVEGVRLVSPGSSTGGPRDPLPLWHADRPAP